MLLRQDLIKDVEEKYVPMLKMVNIVDFTKCIAQFAGIHIKEVKDEVIKEYLLKWAKNKYKFFELLGNKLVLDTDIKYSNTEANVNNEGYCELSMQYPAYALWLDIFKNVRKNKINTDYDLTYREIDRIKQLFPHLSLEGSSVTYFFKKYLNAPDELVTAIGRIYENQEIEAKYTISIDPIDMMLASENPYGWTSCYRLEVDNDCIHADGCLAAILDDSSLITYIWNNEGKFNLQGNYDFKSVRYKRMRQWIAISPDMNAIHFNMIYPGKSSYPNDFCKKLRTIVENLINSEATWKRNETFSLDCYREYGYGYSEYDSDRIYYIADTKPKSWNVFNEQIICPCGCGDYLPGSEPEDDEEVEYNGNGFIAENFSVWVDEEDNGHYCDYIDDTCYAENCDECPVWNREHAVCAETGEDCQNCYEAEDNGDFDPEVTNEVPRGEHCKGCPLAKYHCKKEESATVTVSANTAITYEELMNGTKVNLDNTNKPIYVDEDCYEKLMKEMNSGVSFQYSVNGNNLLTEELRYCGHPIRKAIYTYPVAFEPYTFAEMPPMAD